MWSYHCNLDECLRRFKKMKKRTGIPFEEIKEELLKEPAVAKAYKDLEPEYEIISQIIEARIEQNIIQEELDG